MSSGAGLPVVAVVAALAASLQGCGQGSWDWRTSAAPVSAPASKCPPRDWILQDFGHGHWIINSTDPATWAWYMEFLNVSKASWPAEFHATDMHQYIFWTNSSGIFYQMNHTIPASGFHLLFEADANNMWRPNPYPVLTPAGFDPAAAKVDLLKVRYGFDEPGVPFSDSCHAWRCDMPMVQNVTLANGTLVAKEFIVTFWRELTSPVDMKCTLYITEADSGEAIAPWNKKNPSNPRDAKLQPDKIPGKPQALSYRYFRKTVESMEDALRRLPCRDSGLPSTDGKSHEFC